jgi:GMP synthase-like glutamine amidotransferase
MNPVVIFRHARIEGPGDLGEFLTEQGIPWQLVCIDQNEALPESMEAFSGMVLMGGPMSANDDLPWIRPLLALIRDAVRRDIPLLGHCLGGQLISKALGAEVSRNPVKEIGWGEVKVTPGDETRKWFGDLERFEAFHWHGETFALPHGAVHLLSSRYCQNQAYSIGKHLVFQCHVEMTVEMVGNWCEAGADELKTEIGNPAVQTATEIQRDLQQRIRQLNRVSRLAYRHWVGGLHG